MGSYIFPQTHSRTSIDSRVLYGGGWCRSAPQTIWCLTLTLYVHCFLSYQHSFGNAATRIKNKKFHFNRVIDCQYWNAEICSAQLSSCFNNFLKSQTKNYVNWAETVIETFQLHKKLSFILESNLRNWILLWFQSEIYYRK